MPKISSKSISINNDVNTRFVVDIMYNSELFFYAVIPEELDQHFELISRIKMEELHLTTHRVNKSITKYVCTGKTENEACINCKKAIEFMLTSAVKKRDVIMLFYDEDNKCNYSGVHYNKQHPQIGLRFGITYAVEASLGTKEKQYKTLGGYQISSFHEKFTVIDDTPDNRAFVEDLYLKLELLNKKLGAITETPEQLLKVIASNQKLIG